MASQLSTEARPGAIACESCRSQHVLNASAPELHARIQRATNGLEKRLLETELALFDTLALLSQYEGSQHSPRHRNSGVQLPNGHASAISSELLASHATHQAKISSLEEWAQLPLASEAQRRRWFEKKRTDLETLASGEPLSDAPKSQQQQPQFLPSAAVSTARLVRMSSSSSSANGTLDHSPPHQPRMPSQVQGPRAGQQQGSASPIAESTSSQAQRLSATQWRRFF
ncbi:hypothetical protein CLCR_10588 [Cladophialophora carrionii]|uniref:Uncharacterized protein n=1 Tax=Cladophialophora carrionii TaxID=86049 RepID=A0A1C1CX92_9EURO|nr:hypothetical protein CLCR_10588 [Cladophialophora carrionii]